MNEEHTLRNTLEAVSRFLGHMSTYEKNPPEVCKDDFAYDRLLAWVQSECARFHRVATDALAGCADPKGICVSCRKPIPPGLCQKCADQLLVRRVAERCSGDCKTGPVSGAPQ